MTRASTESLQLSSLAATPREPRASDDPTLGEELALPELIEDPSRLIQELHVHEVELQMQNESLREAQLAVERSHARYRALYDAAPVAYLILSGDGTVIETNRKALELFRTSRPDLVGARLSRYIASEHAERFARHRREVFCSFATARCRLDLLLGSTRRQVRLESARTSESRETWRVAIIDDQDAEALERISRDYGLLSTVFDAAGLLVLLDTRARIVRINGGCRTAICGASKVELVAFWDAFALAEQREHLREQCVDLIRAGGTIDWEGQCLSYDGQEHTIRWRITQLGVGVGALPYLIATGNDLTERKQLEAKLLVSDRLAAMGRLAAGIGHEINNPLAYVITSIELTERTADQVAEQIQVADRQRLLASLSTAREGVERIRLIVEELRSLARGDQSAVQAVDVCQVLDACAQIAGSEMRLRAQLVKQYSAVALVNANRTRLGQVFLNLLINAAQAIAPGDPEHNVIRLVVREQDDWVMIEVHDTGQGIKPEHRDRLFDPFFTTKPLGEGTGLGLSVCHTLVNELLGSITADDGEDGVGSVFRVRLPAAPAASAARPVPCGPQAGEPATHGVRRARHVLIVDDELNLLRSLALVLGEHSVRTAASCREALSLCAQHEYDIIFCDLQMPELGGEDFYCGLAQLRPGHESRIVFMSAGLLAPSVACRARTNPLLSKPFKIADVVALVEGSLIV